MGDEHRVIVMEIPVPNRCARHMGRGIIPFKRKTHSLRVSAPFAVNVNDLNTLSVPKSAKICVTRGVHGRALGCAHGGTSAICDEHFT